MEKQKKFSLIRYCNVCGKEISRVYPGGGYVARYEYSQRRFCSEECSKEFKAVQKKSHSYSQERLHNVWRGMKERCNNPKNVSYKNYGARGIKVCPEWENDYENFKKWSFDNGYKEGLQIDRIDNNKGYSPENCRWVTRTDNLRNKGNNVLITKDGITKTATEWGEELGIHPRTIIGRVRSGYDVEDVLSTEKFIKRGRTGVKNITYSRGKYIVIFNKKYIGSRKTLEEAEELKNKYVAEQIHINA